MENEKNSQSQINLELICQLSESSFWESPLAADGIQILKRLLPYEDVRSIAEDVFTRILLQTTGSVESLDLMLPLLAELLHYRKESACLSLFIDLACNLLPGSFSSLISFLLLALKNSSTDLLLAKLPIILQKAPFSSYSTSLEYAFFLVSLKVPSLTQTQNTILASLDVSSIPSQLFQLLAIACSRGFVSPQDILDVLSQDSLDMEAKAQLVFSLFQGKHLNMDEIAPFVPSFLTSAFPHIQSLGVQLYFENWIQCREISLVQYYELLPSYITVLRQNTQQTQILLQSLIRVFSLPKLIDFDSILCTLGELMDLQSPFYSLKNHCLALQAITLYLEKQKWKGKILFWKKQLSIICSLAKNSYRQNTEWNWSRVLRYLRLICNSDNYMGTSKEGIKLYLQNFFCE